MASAHAAGPDPATVISFLQGACFFALLFTSALTDLERGKVHNLACLLGGGGGLLFSLLRGGLQGAPVSLASSLAAAGLGFAIFFAFYLAGGMGAGDVKLVTATGALAADWRFVLWMTVYTALAGAILAVIVLARHGELVTGLRRSLGGMLRWRYKRASQDNTSGMQKIDTACACAEAAGPATRCVPYAAAVCAGAVWTVISYVRHGSPLPFL